MFIPTGDQPTKWTGFTLVLPAVSVGNVGQLAADLLISTLTLSRVGCFHDDDFLPVVGNDPFAEDDAKKRCAVMTAMEAFADSTRKIMVIQQRSPLVKGHRHSFLEKLMQWVQDGDFADVIVLTSSSSHERMDCQLQGTQLRYLMTDTMKAEHGHTVKTGLGWTELEPRAYDSQSTTNQDSPQIFIPGAGIAKMFYLKSALHNMKTAVLLKFCSEGDNAGDALQLAEYLNGWKHWLPQQLDGDNGARPWKIPSSWKLMFGNRFDQILFR